MRATTSAPTKRQAVLLDRLVTFCGRCGSKDIPVSIARVLGYGSFFRGKDRPGDVDLFVITGQPHPLFDQFRSILEGNEFFGRWSLAPSERMKSIAAAGPDPAVASAAELFAGWLKGFSHAMLYEHKNIVAELYAHEPERFTRRILHSGLPGIKATLDRDGSKPGSKVVREIWTPDRPGVRSAVEGIWANYPRGDLLTEAEWFEEQSREYLLQIAVLRRIAELLVKGRFKVNGGEECTVWYRYVEWLRTAETGFPADLCVRVAKGLPHSGEGGDVANPPGYNAPNFAAFETRKLALIVEEKRRGLVLLAERAAVLKVLTNCLVTWCLSDKNRSKSAKRRYLMEAVALGIPKREVSSRIVAGVLTDELERLGLS